METKEEVIFEGFDEGWQRVLPVRLLTYGDGSMDIHRQTGSQFEEHIKQAEKILFQRGLVIDPKEKHWTIGSTGAYKALIPTLGN